MLSDGTLVIDADSHFTERHDLFTELAPEKYKDRVPHVEVVDDVPTWVFDGHPLGHASAGAVIGRDGQKESADLALNHWAIEDTHVGSYDPKVRLGVLDECGIDAQIMFPNTVGLGGQDLGMVDDEDALQGRDRALQRLHGRHPGRLRRPAPRPAVDAGVERRRVRRRDEARRRPRLRAA